MPIYEYECGECGKFELIQKFSDEPIKECPRCKDIGKQTVVRKVLSLSSFHLKGGGWYKTDYSSGSNDSSGKAKSADAAGGSGDSSSSASSSEKSDGASSKPAGCGTSCGCH